MATEEKEIGQFARMPMFLKPPPPSIPLLFPGPSPLPPLWSVRIFTVLSAAAPV